MGWGVEGGKLSVIMLGQDIILFVCVCACFFFPFLFFSKRLTIAKCARMNPYGKERHETPTRVMTNNMQIVTPILEGGGGGGG